MAKKRFCNYCLGAAHAGDTDPRHPVLPKGAPTPAHLHAFKHSGRSCPHLRLHREIWKLSSCTFYDDVTSLIQDSGLGPGALLKISHRLPSEIYKPWDRMAVVTGIDFANDSLYGLDNGYNYMLKVVEEQGDFLFNWPHGMSLYMYDVLVNNPKIDHDRDLDSQVKALAKERLTSLKFNSQVSKGSFSLDCWNDPPNWHIVYDFLRKSTFEIRVIQPAKLSVPPPKRNINYDHVVKTIRKEGALRSRNIRFYHD